MSHEIDPSEIRDDTGKARPSKRPGRPPSHRIKHINVSLTVEEYHKIKENAKLCSMTPTTYMRLVSLRKQVTEGKLDRDAQRHIYRQISGIANNINQIVRITNTKKDTNQADILALQKELGSVVALFVSIQDDKEPEE